VLPLERVQLHAAILSEQLRQGLRAEGACIGVWTQREDGGVDYEGIAVARAREGHAMGWTIGWDDGVHERLQALRHAHLPNETGGILLGIIDTALKRIQVVDVVEAPPDSVGTPAGFICGVQGLEEREEEARRRTLDAVGYVGHWHSHPPGHSASPSATDMVQVAALANRLDAEGLPSLMCIVGEHATDLTWTLGRQANAMVTVIAGASQAPPPEADA
jgi:integrative and conjugative element protein (TIGR02256 family)